MLLLLLTSYTQAVRSHATNEQHPFSRHETVKAENLGKLEGGVAHQWDVRAHTVPGVSQFAVASVVALAGVALVT